MAYMSPAEIESYQPYRVTDDGLKPLERARQRLVQNGQWHPAQQMGRRWAIGCVALEVTQRCNLDCTICYLSEASETLKDIPLDEVYRRIEQIYQHYGPGTDIQITGGEPTLRKQQDLVAIVQRIRSRGMNCSLFTNGIRASRALLGKLSRAGLMDVAFHVDLTQQRKGFASEKALNAIRLEYIERVRGMRLNVFFNTTVFAGNIDEIPMLARFFVEHADVVNFCSFQLQADTGRGVQRDRPQQMTPEALADRISAGAGCALNFNDGYAGHRSCNRYALTLVAGGRAHDLLDQPGLIAELLDRTEQIRLDRKHRLRTTLRMIVAILRQPALAGRVGAHAARKALKITGDIMRSGGRAHRLAFFIHNFMDACHLEHDRIGACSFMVATPDGPMSMCLHNAKRDHYLLRAFEVKRDNKLLYFNPVTGELLEQKPDKLVPKITQKNARGMARVAVQRRQSTKR